MYLKALHVPFRPPRKFSLSQSNPVLASAQEGGGGAGSACKLAPEAGAGVSTGHKTKQNAQGYNMHFQKVMKPSKDRNNSE